MAHDTLSSIQGDTVDELIWRARGLGAADIGPVLALNPGLADHGAILPIGTAILLPAGNDPLPSTVTLINLWD